MRDISVENGSKVFIHVGYPKSASTTLQKHLFDRHPQINSLSIYPTGNVGQDSLVINKECIFFQDKRLRAFYSDIATLDPIDYAKCERVNSYKQMFAEHIDLQKVNLLSSERFTSVFFAHDSIQDKALRLKQFFPHAKIILVLRNQLDIIASQYRDQPFNPCCIRIGKPVSIDRWVNIAFTDPLVKYSNSLNYYETLRVYSELFGKENVGVFLFEELVSDLRLFARHVSDFLEIDAEDSIACLDGKHENSTVSSRYNAYRRLVRRGLPKIEKLSFLPTGLKTSLSHYLKQGPKAKHVINPEMTTLVREYFRESNQKLQKEFNVNLAKYNYPD